MKNLYGEKIIESLHVIKTVCEDNIDNCVMCPFNVNNVCGIVDLQPHNWKISEYKKFQALE